jgi:hypothetical protein
MVGNLTQMMPVFQYRDKKDSAVFNYQPLKEWYVIFKKAFLMPDSIE